MSSISTDPPALLTATSNWERWMERGVRLISYVLLPISTGIILISERTLEHKAMAFGLAAAAFVWTWAMFTRPGPTSGTPRWQINVYFVGFIALAALMMWHDPIFFVYVISGFFHAFAIRPWPVAFVGVAATSLLVNSMIVRGDPDPEATWFFGLVVVIQTLAIGFGVMGGEKVSELAEERRRALVELQDATSENAGLHAQLIAQAREAGILDERHRMAGEIHDTIAQGLTGVITQLEAARQTDDQTLADRHIDIAASLARESLSEARKSVKALTPTYLEDSRLPEAIAHLAEGWSAASGVEARVATTGTVRHLDPDIEVTLLRVAQEALANVGKHAAASRTMLTLSFMDEAVSLDVRDDGIGFQPRPSVGGFGLGVMRQRVEHVGGTFGIESEPGVGTAISAIIATPEDEGPGD